MSEMFTKCNGFIVSGDPLVYADSATMTGQGTVSEPFGVKNIDLFVQSPLYTGTSGNSAYIGWNNETVLWDGNGTAATSAALNEAITNFEYLGFVLGYPGVTNGLNYQIVPASTPVLHLTYQAGNGASDYFARVYGSISETAIEITRCKMMYSTYTSTSNDTIRNNDASDMKCLYKVIGINRKA